MDLTTAAATITAHIEENLPDWESSDAGSPELEAIYAETNAVMDPDRRVFVPRTLDLLYSRYSAVNSAENPNPRTPTSDRAGELIQKLVHDYVEDLNLALMRAGYPGDRVIADSLEDITKPLIND